MSTSALSDTHIFQLAPSRKGVSVLALLLIAVATFLVSRELVGQLRVHGFPAILSQSGLFWLLVLWVCVFIPLGIYSFLSIQRNRLHLSTDSVEYQTVWYRVQTSWEHVETIGAGRAGEVALLLRQPGTVTGPRWLVRLWRADQAIPLSPFGQWWGDGVLAQALRHYAPSLMAQRRG